MKAASPPPRRYPYDDDTIGKSFNNGNWVERPWFLEEVPLLEHAGFPLHLRRRAARQLEWLYSPEVCLERLLEEDGQHFMTLFTPGALPVCELLELGLELEVVGRFDDPRLLSDLRHGKGFGGALAEVSVWAGLKRAGFDVDRIPAPGDAKSPDFRVYIDGRLVRLEVKASNASAYERTRLDLEHRCNLAILRSLETDIRVEARPTAGWERILETGPDAVRKNLDELAKGLEFAAESCARSGRVPAEYPAGRFAVLVVQKVTREEAFGDCGPLMPPETDEERAHRALRIVRDAADQLRAGIGVVVLDVGESIPPLVFEEALKGQVAARPVHFGSCELVIVRGMAHNRFGEPERYAYPIPIPTFGAPAPLHVRLADSLRFRHYRNPWAGRRGERRIVY